MHIRRGHHHWRGGRIAELLKKGAATICDNYRGLLISDHMSKAFTSIIDRYIDPLYTAFLSPEQCGGVVGKGTDLASHVVRSAIDFAKLFSLSIFMLFVDLTKAFDFALREVVLGWPQGVYEDKVKLLQNIGLSEHRARQVAADIDCDGCVLQKLQAHPHIISLLASLHTKSWFTFGKDGRAMVVNRGG